MAAVTTSTRYQGVSVQLVAYAATSTPTLVANENNPLVVSYAQLTGAMTINAVVTKLKQFQPVTFLFSTDGTQRIVTLGTGFISSGTVTIAANKNAVVDGIFDGTSIRISSREIES